MKLKSSSSDGKDKHPTNISPYIAHLRSRESRSYEVRKERRYLNRHALKYNLLTRRLLYLLTKSKIRSQNSGISAQKYSHN